MTKTEIVKKNGQGFVSPTHGWLSFAQVMEKVEAFVGEEPGKEYVIIVGTDSQGVDLTTADFVSAIVVHRVGHGGIYFWKRFRREKIFGLRERIYEEAVASLDLAEEVIGGLKKIGLWSAKKASLGEKGLSLADGFPSLEIHVDIGRKGPTRELIAEVIGMIRGAGYVAKMKPEAVGAAKVADRHT